MKPKTKPRALSHVLVLGAALLFTANLHADNGTWDAIAAGNWDDLANWNAGAGPIADGAEFTATFDNVITADLTVTLVDPRTIGNITAADTSHNYTLSGDTLTLEDADTPVIDVGTSSRTLTINSVIDGVDGLKKTGSGTLNLYGTNTFTGDVVVDGGTFAVGADNAFGDITINGSNLNVDLTTSAGPGVLGAEGANVFFTGSSSFTASAQHWRSIVKNVSISGTTTFAMSTQFYDQQFTGVLSGAGTIVKNDSNGILTFSNASNTFTGAIRLDAGTGGLVVNSLADSANTIQFNGHTGAFSLGSGTASPLVFNSRQIVLSHTNGGKINNNNATTSNTITINTDLGFTNTGTRTLTLGGSNTGDNTFAGEIGDNGASAVSFTKDDAGKWILTGPNTYTGNTTIGNGTLEIGGAGQLGGGSYAGSISIGSGDQLIFNSSAEQTFSGVISGLGALIKDNSGTLSLTNANTYTGNTTVNGTGTLSLGDGTNNSNLDDFSTVSVASGAVLNLNYVGSDTVLLLNLGGSPAAAGTWGRIDSIVDLGADFESALITGDGLINNLDGDTTSIGAYFWDGGNSNIGSDGNATATYSTGTWSTTIQNWDVGFTAHAAWPNTTSAKAYFYRTGNGNNTITLGSDITLGEIDYRGTANNQLLTFGNASEDNFLNFGGAALITTDDYYVTFQSGITGTPTINYTARQNDNASKLTLAPADSVTMAVGAINMIKSPITVKNCILELGGNGLGGNSASSVTWSNVAQQLALNKVGTGTWTLSGGWDNSPMGDSQWKVQGGTLILDGNYNISHRLDVESGGTLKGNATLRVERTTATEHVRVLAGGTMAPGTSIGTINVNDKAEIAGTLEIEVNGATADLLAITGDLDLSAVGNTIEVLELGAATLTDYLVVTYTGALSGTFDNETLPAGYSVDYGTSGEIHLTVVGGGGTDYATWLSGFTLTDTTFNGDDDADNLGNGIEAFFGTDPSVSSTGIAEVAKSGSTVTFTHPNPDAIDVVTDVTGSYEWSVDMVTWYADDGVEGPGATTVTTVATPDNPGANVTTVVATIAGTVPEKLFLRVVATGP